MAEFKNDYMTPEEREAYSRKLQEFATESARQRWAEGKAGQLCEQLYRAYTEYKEYLERNYRASRDADCVETVSQQLYLRLRKNLDKAHQSERCAHVKPNGRRCGSPRMKEGQLCYVHARMAEVKSQKLGLPSLEDANGVQLAIMKLMQLLIDDQVDTKKAGMIAYLIQTAANNVGRVKLEEEEELAG
jgi:hypothetical protein